MLPANNFLLGALTDLFPPDLTADQLHAFTKADIGVCVRVLQEVRALRAQEEQKFLEDFQNEILKDRFERRRHAA